MIRYWLSCSLYFDKSCTRFDISAKDYLRCIRTFDRKHLSPLRGGFKQDVRDELKHAVNTWNECSCYTRGFQLL